MITIFRILIVLFLSFPPLSGLQLQLVSTESDPDAFIEHQVNVINGDYCESATDLMITGPDALLLQRFYSTNTFAGHASSGWRILPQRFLVIGKNPSSKFYTKGRDRFEQMIALTGERSGGILPYSAWKNQDNILTSPFDLEMDIALGITNTYAKNISGQTNHRNHRLYENGDAYELILGDGTKRIYKKILQLPSLLLGEELTPIMAMQVVDPSYFILTQEILPSGNQLFFSYDADGHLSCIEMKNKAQTKTLSWIRLRYDFYDKGCLIQLETSDTKTLTYHLTLKDETYQLDKVEGSHAIPIVYEYRQGLLVRKTLPKGGFIEIGYANQKVKTLKGPNPHSGRSQTLYSFSYGKYYTDVLNALNIKTRYIYDKRLQLTEIKRYDEKNNLYRVDKKYWGETPSQMGLLLAKTIEDGNGRVQSYRGFEYDSFGNAIVESLYGNLTGKQEVSLDVSLDGTLRNPDYEECQVKTFKYSEDGFNLLTEMGDSKGNQTRYIYQTGSNLLLKKFITERKSIKKRTYNTYNDDGVCIKIIEDDGSEEDANKIYGLGVTERHIKEIKPKETLPGIGLPEMIEERALDLQKKQEILVKRLVYAYDDQARPISCEMYDTNGQYAFTERRTYHPLGQTASKIDAAGREVTYEYDEIGNQISISLPHKNQWISIAYDFQNHPIKITTDTNENSFITEHVYDILGRKTSSTDRFHEQTFYEYDAFNRLKKVIYPKVLDESGSANRPTFSYTYDLFGNAITIQDPTGFITSKFYNLRGSPTKILYPDDTYEIFKYDAEGSLHRSLTRDQILTVYEYDYLGRNIHEEISTINENKTPSFVKGNFREYNGFRCTAEKEDKLIKRYHYDPAGRLLTFIEHIPGFNEKDPESHIKAMIYDSLGRIHQQKIWFDSGPQDYALECFEYDLSGNVLEKRIEDAQGNLLLQKGFLYNTDNQCIEEYTTENGSKKILCKMSYNSEGELISYVDGLNQETKINIGSAYNAIGQTVLKKTIINPLGLQTEIEFDALSRIFSIKKKNPWGILFSTLLSSQKILYDLLGNKVCEVHDQIANGKVLSSQKNRWVYGPMGRLEEEIEAAESPLERRTFYHYNSFGKISKKTIQGLEASLDYIYNKQGWLQKIQSQNTKKEHSIFNEYNYDSQGNIVYAFNPQTSINRTYNSFNQITKENIQYGGTFYVLSYNYDKKGRIKQITLPDKSEIKYTYDAAFGRSVKRISSKGDVLYEHTYDLYDSQGKLLTESLIAHGGIQTYTYDPNGQKIGIYSDFLNEQYIRDALGRLSQVKGKNKKEYTYNPLSQLILEKQKTTKTYAYDSLDNRIQLNSDPLLYNTLNQLTSDPKTQFSYDSQGNLLRKVLDGEQTQFEYDALSQLISIEKADKTSFLFIYDAFGRLICETQTDKDKKRISTPCYLYLGQQEIGTVKQQNRVNSLKVPGLNGDQLSLKSIAFEIENDTYLPIHDIGGNVTHLVDPRTRNLIESYQYTAFGEEVILNSKGKPEKKSPTANPWRFAEKRINENTGLIFFGIRFYDPISSRWIQPDPIGFADGPNRYAYLHNNPLSYLDPFGLATETHSQKQFIEYFYGALEPHCFCEKHRTCKRGGDIWRTNNNSLPTISYCDSFEEVHAIAGNRHEIWDSNQFEPEFEKSHLYHLNLPELQNMGIGFINGIDNSKEQAKASAEYVSRLTGGFNVHAVYNATHGIEADLSECRMGLNYTATEPVRLLHKMWNSFFEKCSANAKFLMICHSQGAIHVRNALLDYPPELRKHILVVAIAPGGYVYKESCAQVVHYRASVARDYIPRLDWAGARREKDSTTTLLSHPNAPMHDHSFTSPTYLERLQSHLLNYILNHGESL